MEGESWWPQGVALSSIDEALESGEVSTKWGTVACWDVQECFKPEWWASAKEGAWGVIEELRPTVIDVVQSEGNRALIRLDDTHIALVYSIPTSNRTSSLQQKNEVRSILQSTRLLLPIGGLLLDGKDALLAVSYTHLTLPTTPYV